MGIVIAGTMITGVLLLLVLGGIWVLVASARKQKRKEQAANQFANTYGVEPGVGLGRVGRHQRPGHLLHSEDNSLTVDELVAEATAEGRPVRLNWGDDDQGRAEGKPRDGGNIGGEWPTGGVAERGGRTGVDTSQRKTTGRHCHE